MNQAGRPTGIRLSKLMAQRGMCSRREADRLIERGHVRVDGQTVTRLGTRIDPASEIVVTPAARAVQKALLTVLLNKPPGLVSNQPEKGYREAVSLITRANRDTTCARHVEPLPDHRTLHVAGRLDIDSSGLLVLTQDGRIARQLIGPESNVEKEYAVRLNKIPSESTLTRLNGEMILDGRHLKPVTVSSTGGHTLHFVLTEGRKRQIRRMCDLVGLTIASLTRIRIGQVGLGELRRGQWRYLQQDEHF